MQIIINNFDELAQFINLFRHLDDDKIKTLTNQLNKSSDKLIQAEKKDENASTGSHRS